jgi:hypothetical protein
VVTITTSFTPPDGDQVSGITTDIDYPEAKVSLPGIGNAPEVLARITNLSGIANGIFTGSDNNDSNVSIGLVVIPGPINPGSFASVRFDCVSGAAVPTAGEFPCTPVISSFLGNTVPGTCSASVSLQ